jgi:anti-sigma B factor antagonist
MFKLSTNERGEVAFSGTLTAHHVERIRRELQGRRESYRIDVSRLRHVSSAGLGLLVSLQEALREYGAMFTLVNPTPHVREVIRLTRLDDSFPIEEREANGA